MKRIDSQRLQRRKKAGEGQLQKPERAPTAEQAEEENFYLPMAALAEEGLQLWANSRAEWAREL